MLEISDVNKETWYTGHGSKVSSIDEFLNSLMSLLWCYYSDQQLCQVIEELQSMREKNDILQSEIDYFKDEYKKMR